MKFSTVIFSRHLSLLGIILFLGACSEQSSSGETLKESLLDQTNMPEALAGCFSEKAETELDDNGRAFLIASVQDDEARIRELRGKMTIAELTQASMFMASAGAACGLDEHFAQEDS